MLGFRGGVKGVLQELLQSGSMLTVAPYFVSREQYCKGNSIRNPFPLDDQSSNDKQARGDVNTISVSLGEKGVRRRGRHGVFLAREIVEADTVGLWEETVKL